MSSFSNTDTGSKPADPYTLQNKEEPSLKEKVEGLFSFIGSEGTSELSEAVATPPPMENNDQMLIQNRVAETLGLRHELETLQGRQYWRKGWRPDIELDSKFDLGEPSTLSMCYVCVHCSSLTNNKDRAFQR